MVVLGSRIVLVLMFSAVHGYDLLNALFVLTICLMIRVCFSIVDDCLPLVEENFREVIQTNYYTKTKFNCKLTSEQVSAHCICIYWKSLDLFGW